MPTRIAMLSMHTSPLDQPGSGDAGGMNVYIRSLSLALARLGFEITIYTRARSSDELVPAVLDRNVVVQGVQAGPLAPLAKEQLLAYVPAFAAAVSAFRPPDLVHAHYWLSGVAAETAWADGAFRAHPVVDTFHTIGALKNRIVTEGGGREPDERLAGERTAAAAADMIIVNAQFGADAVAAELSVPDDRIVTIAPGVDLDVFRAATARQTRHDRELLFAGAGLDSSKPLVLCVGRIQPLKGQDVLVRALSEFDVAERPQLLVLGDSTASHEAYRAALEDAVANHSLGQWVRFGPAVSQENLARWYRSAAIVAIPSRLETFGLVAVEAAACGTPVVATRIGGLESAVVDGSTGVLVDGDGPREWASALRDTLDSVRLHDHVDLRARSLGVARSWDTMATEVADVYASLRSIAHTPSKLKGKRIGE